MPHDHNHRFLQPKAELRTPAVDRIVFVLGKLITSPRGSAQASIAQFNDLKKNHQADLDLALDSFNIPKEDLLKIISAYETLLNTTEDLC